MIGKIIPYYPKLILQKNYIDESVHEQEKHIKTKNNKKKWTTIRL